MARAPTHPLIQFRTLGAIDLREPSGDEILGVLNQPKRLALLAYLAIARPNGFHRRDTLLSLFWPELDLPHARDALNQAIRHLRLKLGAEVVVSRGATDVGLDGERFWCDAVAFRAAITAQLLQPAADLYHGDLLAGFFTSGVAPEFEQWLENERAALKTLNAGALESLAADATAHGDHARAVQHMRALGALSPLNGHAARGLMEALVAAGDRDSALAVATRYATQVRKQLDAEPDAGVVALASELRTRASVRPVAIRAPRSTERVISTLAAPAISEPRNGLRKRAWLRGMAAALPLGVLLILRGAVPPDAPTVATIDANLLAVAPFDVLSPEQQLWREGLVDLLSSELEGAGPLHTVSPSSVIKRWSGRADRTSAASLGKATRAGLVVYGNVVTTGGDSVRVSTRLLDVAAGTVSEIEVREQQSRLDRVADSVSIRVLRELGRTRPIAAVTSAGFASASLPALKAYLAGEQFYRRVKRDSALVYYGRAVSLDTAFALAWYKLARVRSMGVPENDDTVGIYGRRAGALNRGLSPRDSLLVLAESLYAVPQEALGAEGQRRLHATLEEATRRFPRDAEAWYQLGRARVYSPTIGTTAEGTLATIDSAIHLDSAFAPAVDWLSAVKLALRLDDTRAARRYLLLGMTWEPKQAQDGLRFAVSMLADPRSQLRGMTRWMDTASTRAIDVAALALEDWPDSAESAVLLRRELLARARHSNDTSSHGAVFDLSYALARRGHLSEAYWMNPDRGWHLFTQVALFGGVPAESVEARAKHRLAASLPWFAKRRDTVALKSAVHALDSLARESRRHGGSPTPAWDAARGHAYLTLARGDTAEAIRRFIPIIDSLCPGCSFSRHYVDIYSAAPLLWSRGLERKTESWLDFDNLTVFRPVFDVWFALARGRVAERLGNKAKAIAAYRFVKESWAHGDPQLQADVAEARAALARLGATAR